MKLVCVVGAHRLETSLVAHILGELGVEFGSSFASMDDETGRAGTSAIDRQIRRFNERLLDSTPSGTHRWDAAEFDDLRKEARSVLEARMTDPALPIGIADPTTSFTLPFWQSLVEASHTVLALRHPAAGTNSYSHDQGTDPEESQRDWTRHVVAAWLDDPHGVTIACEDVVADPAGTAGRLAAALSLDTPDHDTVARIENLVVDHAVPTDTHSPQHGTSDGGFARALYEALRTDSGVDEANAILRGEAETLRSTDASDAEHRLARVQADYDRLRNRRSVRAALGLANLLRPLFRSVRWLRTRLAGRFDAATESTPEQQRTATEPGTTRDLASASRRDVATGFRTEAPIDLLSTGPGLVDVATLRRLRRTSPVTVVVPVFNAPDAIARCLTALRRNTTVARTNLLIIDDASTEPEVRQILSAAAAAPNTTVVRNDENLGFVRSVNRGFAMARGDVVVLNSDTEVTPRWLENLILAAYRDPGVGIVSPLSNNAGAFSAPETGENTVPSDRSFDDVARLVTRMSQRLYPTAPTGHGFCMYVKRALLDVTGPFDAESFPRGYGEENDLSMRAMAAGWSCIIDDATYIYHAQGASFQNERRELMRRGRETMRRLHPDYDRRVQEFLRDPQVAAARRNVGSALAALSTERTTAPRRVLYVLHSGGGGTPQTTADLMSALPDTYAPYVLTSDGQCLTLSESSNGVVTEIDTLRLRHPISITDFEHPEYQSLVANLLLRHDIGLIHIRQLIRHSLDLPLIAASLRIPVVLSFHDYYYVCPTVHLLDETETFCAGRCTSGPGPCRLPTSWLAQAPPPKHDFVYAWRELMDRRFAEIDAFVTTSPAARELYLSVFPQLNGRDFRVIEHGRDLEQRNVAAPPTESKIKILLPGNLDPHKGGELVRGIKQADTTDRIEFHFLGTVKARLREFGVNHGTYAREEFPSLAAAIAPAFVGVFSISAETYSHIVSEAWASGIPVLTTDLGAPGERIRRHGGGWLISHTDPARAYEQILEIADDPETYAWGVETARLENVRTTAGMAADYDALYRDVVDRSRVFEASQPGGSEGQPS